MMFVRRHCQVSGLSRAIKTVSTMLRHAISFLALVVMVFTVFTSAAPIPAQGLVKKTLKQAKLKRGIAGRDNVAARAYPSNYRRATQAYPSKALSI
ncbi:hypothetical protein C8J56DRAFT_978542 [Mycena floridula]|nr:hypothetical protein C8J56DRAFT_978542 [Mycena floridula]